MRGATGWTLVETMIALCVGAVLCSLAISGLGHARAAVLAAEARASLEDSFRAAARASLLHRLHYVVCSSTTGKSCEERLDWEKGWIVFADADRDGQPDTDRAVWKSRAALNEGVLLRGTQGRTRIVFQPEGRTAGGSNASFYLCDRRGPTHATRLILSARGDVRAVKPDPLRPLECP